MLLPKKLSKQVTVLRKSDHSFGKLVLNVTPDVHSMCSNWVDVKTISKVSVACVEKNKKIPMLAKMLGALSLTRHLGSKSVVRITFLSFYFKPQIRKLFWRKAKIRQYRQQLRFYTYLLHETNDPKTHLWSYGALSNIYWI